MKECAAEGILQSYVDGELAQEAAERVASHAKGCEACAAALIAITSETAIFAKAFDAEMSLSVPSERIRERLYRRIEEMNSAPVFATESHGWRFAGWLASLTDRFRLSPQRAVAFAASIALIAVLAIFGTRLIRQPGPTSTQDQVAGAVAPGEISKPKVAPTPTPGVTPEKNDGEKRPRAPRSPAPILVPQPDQLPRDALASVRPLPGEADYLDAIDSLSKEIETSDEARMKPSLRAEYERNLAVIDHAIDETRRSARRNRRDRDAAQFLYASYQNKIDLLNAVAQQVRPTIATR